MKSLSTKKLILIGFIAVLLVAIPLAIYFLQQQQQTTTQAEQATTLSFEPTSSATAPITAEVGQPVSLDVVVDPGVNQNLVSFVRLEVQYDPTILTPADENGDPKPFAENTAALTLLEGPVIEPGSITATLSVGVDPTKVIQTKTTIATLNFVATNPTGETPTEVTFSTNSQVLSAGTGDQANENVLASTIPAFVTVGGEGTEVTPTLPDGEEPSVTPSISATPSASPSPTTGSSNNVGPVCESLSSTGSTTGTAPFAVALNAVGSDSDGNIVRATFSFGDGQIQAVTTGGGLGTSAADVTISHTYQAAGSYQASVVFTDNDGGVSSGDCTVNITATSGTSTSGGGSTTTATSTPTAVPAPDATLASTGPGDIVVLAGILTSIVTIIGAVIFFAL